MIDDLLHSKNILFRDDVKGCNSPIYQIWRVTRAFLNFHPHSKFSPAFTRILHKSPAITRILFDEIKIAQANTFAGRKEEYCS